MYNVTVQSQGDFRIYRGHACMDDDIYENFFGEKPYRDEALA